MRFQKLTLCMIATWFCGLSLLAQDFYWQGLLFNVVTEQPPTARLANARRCMASFTVPETVAYNGKDYAVKVMGYETFRYLDCIYTINLSDVETIDDGYVVYYEDNGTTRYYGCFVNCENLEFVQGDHLKYIGDYAFLGCASLPKIDLALGEHLGKYAFANCSALKKIYLGEKMKKLGENCFLNDGAIMEVYCMAPEPPLCDSSAFSDKVYFSAQLFVPVGARPAYQKAEGWKKFKNILEVEATSISVADKNLPSLHIKGSSVCIADVAKGNVASFYDLNGLLIKSVKSPGYAFNVALSPGKVYLVKIGDRLYKISI